MESTARVLVVDDEERFRKSMARILRSKGYVVDEVGDGMAALNTLATGGFDVVLLDLKMPEMSGEETFQEIRLQGFDVETICLTGHVSIDDATRLLRRGVFDYLVKPASVDEILGAVQRAMEKKQLRNDEIAIDQLFRNSAMR
ncbi:response regulator [Pseudodesulfovibrio sp. JC047]|uniref:response regulator n=1 Tax=Pseudodesulfovibrio sp. JC047 TaxID=2683199 RepID=UPI0013D875A0|nr:response regulator [Pseudodesulfovibrio sp. JC047]NDV19864.1 response regulator [Pseudodesulfovibrio sp. JC047]